MAISPKVFISYSRDSEEHSNRVLSLADRLRADGIDCIIDQYLVAPSQGWLLWMEQQLEAADFVLVVSTETYMQRATGRVSRGKGIGAQFESILIAEDLYEGATWTEKLIPVLFEGSTQQHIIKPLRSYRSFQADSPPGYEALYGRLTGRREIPPLGKRQIVETQLEGEDLSRQLESLYEHREQLSIAGHDTSRADQEILDVRRLLRQGPQLHPGEFLLDGRFKLVEVLGQGGFATVWKAYDRREHGLVAVKVLHGHYSQDRSRRERFFRGARKMAELGHPHIVRVTEKELEDEGWYFFVMEYLGGGDFRDVVLDRTLSIAERLVVVLQIGDALEFAHRQGMVHRDVKPSNILLDGEGQAKLADFDLVRADDTTGLTATRAMMGTLLFAAPESLAAARDVGPPADVYSLGSTTVFALRGEALPPDYYREPSQAVSALEVSEELRGVLAKATSLDLGGRFQTIAEYCSALEEAVGYRMASSGSPIDDHTGQKALEFSDDSVVLTDSESGTKISVINIHASMASHASEPTLKWGLDREAKKAVVKLAFLGVFWLIIGVWSIGLIF